MVGAMAGDKPKPGGKGTPNSKVDLGEDSRGSALPSTALVGEALRTKTKLTGVQKTLQRSGFQDLRKQQARAQALGATPTTQPMPAPAPMSTALPKFDGAEAAKALIDKDSWRAVIAPVQSREGQRSRQVYEQVLLQFAVASNPRYEAEASGKTRGHLFVSDVSRAMGCEVPHFLGVKELNLAQTMDWIRHQGPMRGWVRTPEAEVLARVNAGHLVLAMPRDIRSLGLAVVVPGSDIKLCGAGAQRGWAMSGDELLGHSLLDYYWHL